MAETAIPSKTGASDLPSQEQNGQGQAIESTELASENENPNGDVPLILEDAKSGETEGTTEAKSAGIDEARGKTSERVEGARQYNDRKRFTQRGPSFKQRRSENNKFDPKARQESSDPAEIRKQASV